MKKRILPYMFVVMVFFNSCILDTKNQEIVFNENTLNLLGQKISLGDKWQSAPNTWSTEVVDGLAFETEDKIAYRNKNKYISTYKNIVFEIAYLFEKDDKLKITINNIEFNSQMYREDVIKVIKSNPQQLKIAKNEDSYIKVQIVSNQSTSIYFWFYYTDKTTKVPLSTITFHSNKYDFDYSTVIDNSSKE